MKNQFLPLNFQSSATSSNISSSPFPSFETSHLLPRFRHSGPMDFTQSFERFTTQTSRNLSIETEQLEFPLFTTLPSATHLNVSFPPVSNSAVPHTSTLRMKLPSSLQTPKLLRQWIDNRRIRPLPDSTSSLPFLLLSLPLPLHPRFLWLDPNPVSPLRTRVNDSPSLDSSVDRDPLPSITAKQTLSF